MTERFDRLATLLKELFQLDKPDLDFGFYRIMHAKEAEVTRFLEHDLLPQVKHAFQQYRSTDHATLEQQLAEAQRDARGLGFDPDEAPKVQELRRAINAGTDVDALEADVYDHLYRFFRRYYSEGDFISQRVYKDGVYAIPYQGEEVKLHWANADQYYIKTTEYLKDYSFRLRPEATRDPMRVHFRLADAAEGEHGNIKAVDEKARRFVLLADDFVAEEEGPDGLRELVIRFEYRPATPDDLPPEKRKGRTRPPQQQELNEAAATALLAASDRSLARWIKELAATHLKADGVRADYSRLQAHLNRYTARNTYDYFIHKDLGGFLRQELDFYVKNEVMRLDDIEHESAPRVEEWLSKIWVIRAIAHKIIDFLAQLEGFQKKLWLKKKFVVETSYCVAVGSLPEPFLAEIVGNRHQHDEWVDLHGIAGFSGDLASPAYSNPLTTAFLRAHPTLMVDTRHFSADVTERMLEALGTDTSLDEITDGVLFHSENFQALRLMERRYRRRVDCVYTDPPYNAQSSEILYKNNYKHASWLSLMDNRLDVARALLSDAATFVIAIDETEQERLGQLLSLHFSDFAKHCIVVEHNPSGQQGDNFSYTHEYAYFLHPVPGRYIAEQFREDPSKWDKRNFRDVTGEESVRTAAKNCFYAILIRDNGVVGFGDVCPEDYHPSINEELADGVIAVYPIDPKGVERKWRFSRRTVETIKEELVVHYLKGRGVYDIKRLKKKFNYKSNWTDARYSANNHGTQFLNNIIPGAATLYPKSIHTVRDCCHAALNDKNGLVLDYFAGSGTTGHAVINLNRDGGHRRFILIEMAHYFDSVLLPRIKKVTFSPQWEDGRPARLATPEEAESSPQIVKVIRLESYEDTLNNLLVRRPEQVQRLLDENTDGGPNAAGEDYSIRYMLDVETADSPSLLDLSAFLDPSAYRLTIKSPGSDESREVAVDLIETFNWLLGLRVVWLSATRRYGLELGDVGARGNQAADSVSLKEAPDGGWWFRTVKGLLPDDRRALVIWRNRPGGDEPGGIERDNAVLDAWFRESGYEARQGEFDLIYANGDHNLESLKETDQIWTSHTIEEDFKRLMFEDPEEGEGTW